MKGIAERISRAVVQSCPQKARKPRSLDASTPRRLDPETPRCLDA